MTFKPRIVPATPEPPAEQVKRRVRAMPKPAAMLQCRCGCRDMLEVRTGVMLVDGQPKGGESQFLCAACFLKGDRVVVA